mmetsp:Transcript_20649/g.58751  ORF Transcript_20649/g.58751 Transcript_20649/m.58751 type:complete len:273 (-) Transcript_20649:65-883(-)
MRARRSSSGTAGGGPAAAAVCSARTNSWSSTSPLPSMSKRRMIASSCWGEMSGCKLRRVGSSSCRVNLPSLLASSWKKSSSGRLPSLAMELEMRARTSCCDPTAAGPCADAGARSRRRPAGLSSAPQNSSSSTSPLPSESNSRNRASSCWGDRSGCRLRSVGSNSWRPSLPSLFASSCRNRSSGLRPSLATELAIRVRMSCSQAAGCPSTVAAGWCSGGAFAWRAWAGASSARQNSWSSTWPLPFWSKRPKSASSCGFDRSGCRLRSVGSSS